MCVQVTLYCILSSSILINLGNVPHLVTSVLLIQSQATYPWAATCLIQS